MEKKPYLVDAVIGNSRFLGSMTQTGRLVRLWWPNVDFPQHVDTIRSGIRMNGATTSWFDSTEEGWQHEAAYLPRTNIFHVSAKSDELPIEVETSSFAVPGEDIVAFRYQFMNRSDRPVSFQFVYYSSMSVTESPYYHTTEFDVEHDALVHFRHRYFFMASSANVCTKYQAAQAWDNAVRGSLDGSRIQMAPDGAMEWAFEDIQPGATVSLPVYITAGHNLEDAQAAMTTAKSRTVEEWLDETTAYWDGFLNSANPSPIKESRIAQLYERSLLTMKLMADEQTGSIIAAPEFDENFSRCGGYAYCWGRDAAFITTALDRAGLTNLSDRFYEWTLTAQDANGAWQQRHYHDGTLAPSWGIQLDEGASILWGMYQHYLVLKNEEQSQFLHQVWNAVEAGANYLVQMMDKETGLPRASRDLWEERGAQHTYTAAAVYAGLHAAASFADVSDRPNLASIWRSASEQIADAILHSCWNESNQVFYRGLKLEVTESTYIEAQQQGYATSKTSREKGYPVYMLEQDRVVDVSLLGISVPFAVIPASHEYAVKTADTIERLLTSPVVGGIKRYEDDNYIGGNPWILTTLWLAQYRIQNGQIDEAKALLHWVIDHQTATGLLPEQVDRETGKTAWVVPLTWSHAMFILAVHMLAEAGEHI
ncbi:glycoside hydrolase family 15 [Paenibacillus selenitireducens]|uniref:Glycoside hydrolase family 15 n=2 Tax=Paenibacillus selenitireducens TaxID=1324314 RepID=A0A1T2X9V0_9BACL|nr:glycoside hydrolase family 15 [Paenibacillus selenitireducens]